MKSIPAWVLGIRRNLAISILGLLVALNLYLTYANQQGRALIIPGQVRSGPTIPFSKTFLFWTPSFRQGTCGAGAPESSEEVFNARLAQKFGGWTRWQVTGSGPEGKIEDGWFYQVSLAKRAPSVSLEDIEDLVKGCFFQKTYYVIETQHR